MIYSGLIVSIYKNPTYVKSSNNGISERYNQALVICDNAPFEVDTEKLEKTKMPVIKIVKRVINGENIYNAKVIFDPDLDFSEYENKNSMAGGSFVYCSDSRFSGLIDFYGAVSLHDRYEGNYESFKY